MTEEEERLHLYTTKPRTPDDAQEQWRVTGHDTLEFLGQLQDEALRSTGWEPTAEYLRLSETDEYVTCKKSHPHATGTWRHRDHGLFHRIAALSKMRSTWTDEDVARELDSRVLRGH